MAIGKGPSQEEKIKQIISFMDVLVNDVSIPKNVRKSVGDAREKLLSNDEIIVKTSGAVYALEEVSNDINMPAHARTQVWTIVSALESIRG